ncbi:MAG: DUF6265 family protein [Gemmatimonadota bacterium]
MQYGLMTAALLAMGTLSVGTVPSEHAAGIQRVAWLSGCWELHRGGQTIEEQWMRPLGGSMLGMARTVKGETLVEYELVVIREEGDRLSYEAHPSGQPTTTFKSIVLDDRSVVFENLQHDFPQRVGYTLSDSGVTAWIEGTMKRTAVPPQRLFRPRATIHPTSAAITMSRTSIHGPPYPPIQP